MPRPILEKIDAAISSAQKLLVELEVRNTNKAEAVAKKDARKAGEKSSKSDRAALLEARREHAAQLLADANEAAAAAAQAAEDAAAQEDAATMELERLENRQDDDEEEEEDEEADPEDERWHLHGGFGDEQYAEVEGASDEEYA